jgi:hypothetical protein
MNRSRPLQFGLSLLLLAALSAGLIVLPESTPRQAAAAGVAADSADLFGPACGKARIDGVVNTSADDWGGASVKAVSMVSGTGKDPLTVTIRVKNSRYFLYMGFTINDDEFSTYGEYLPSGDGFVIVFDDDLSGSVIEINNNVIGLAAGLPQFEDRYIYNLTGSNHEDPLGGGSADGNGLATRTNNRNHFEMRFPLCSGDALDFCLRPSDTTGFRLEYLDAEADGSFGGTYFYPGTEGSAEAQIKIGTCSTADVYILLPVIRK